MLQEYESHLTNLKKQNTLITQDDFELLRNQRNTILNELALKLQDITDLETKEQILQTFNEVERALDSFLESEKRLNTQTTRFASIAKRRKETHPEREQVLKDFIANPNSDENKQRFRQSFAIAPLTPKAYCTLHFRSIPELQQECLTETCTSDKQCTKTITKLKKFKEWTADDYCARYNIQPKVLAECMRQGCTDFKDCETKVSALDTQFQFKSGFCDQLSNETWKANCNAKEHLTCTSEAECTQMMVDENVFTLEEYNRARIPEIAQEIKELQVTKEGLNVVLTHHQDNIPNELIVEDIQHINQEQQALKQTQQSLSLLETIQNSKAQLRKTEKIVYEKPEESNLLTEIRKGVQLKKVTTTTPIKPARAIAKSDYVEQPVIMHVYFKNLDNDVIAIFNNKTMFPNIIRVIRDTSVRLDVGELVQSAKDANNDIQKLAVIVERLSYYDSPRMTDNAHEYLHFLELYVMGLIAIELVRTTTLQKVCWNQRNFKSKSITSFELACLQPDVYLEQWAKFEADARLLASNANVLFQSTANLCTNNVRKLTCDDITIRLKSIFERLAQFQHTYNLQTAQGSLQQSLDFGKLYLDTLAFEKKYPGFEGFVDANIVRYFAYHKTNTVKHRADKAIAFLYARCANMECTKLVEKEACLNNANSYVCDQFSLYNTSSKSDNAFKQAQAQFSNTEETPQQLCERHKRELQKEIDEQQSTGFEDPERIAQMRSNLSAVCLK